MTSLKLVDLCPNIIFVEIICARIVDDGDWWQTGGDAGGVPYFPVSRCFCFILFLSLFRLEMG